jgi:hypothetical protein
MNFYLSNNLQLLDEVHKILQQLRLDDTYGAIFAEQEIDMETFLTLTDVDLRDSLDIREMSDRITILAAVARLNRQLSAGS